MNCRPVANRRGSKRFECTFARFEKCKNPNIISRCPCFCRAVLEAKEACIQESHRVLHQSYTKRAGQAFGGCFHGTTSRQPATKHPKASHGWPREPAGHLDHTNNGCGFRRSTSMVKNTKPQRGGSTGTFNVMLVDKDLASYSEWSIGVTVHELSAQTNLSWT